jgi:hypothetical protein
MNNQEFLDILQQFVTKYDKQNRSYPESEYEGVYSDDPENGYAYDIGTKVQE